MRLRWAEVALLSATVGLWGCEGRSDTRPRSVLLIVVDTLRADHLGLHGYERPTSPRIDALAQRGVVFERAQSVSSWTLPSMASLLTGVLPSRHGCGVDRESSADAVVRGFLGLHRDVPTLAETLASQGFWTAALVTNNFLKPSFGMDRGFASYSAHFPMDADEAVDELLAAFESRPDKPYFVLAHFMDPHLPYEAGEGFAGRFTEGIASELSLPVDEIRRLRTTAAQVSAPERAFITAAYDEEIAWVDAQIGRLLDTLRTSGDLDDTLIVLTSDHGEELFEHDGFEHGHSMYQELLHVPLIVTGPGVAPRRVTTAVSLLDVSATICALLGTSAGELEGESLVPLIRGEELPPRIAYSEGTLYGEDQRALLSWPLKLMTRPASSSAFDLERDPDEATRLPGTAFPDLLREMETRLSAERARRGSAAPAEIDPEMQEQLRKLGYTGD